jgi:uracil-DNA glycosylase family 4
MGQTKLIEDEGCKLCRLYKTRNNIVWIRGTATENIDVLFVGEAPGRDEDLKGKPFIGRAGKILDKWIEETGLINYAIVNIVKCRPPENRVPSKAEIGACIKHFETQVEELSPKLIVALGKTAMSVLINRTEVLPNVGKLFRSRYGIVFILFHPSYVLRGANVYVPIKELIDICRNLKIELIG